MGAFAKQWYRIMDSRIKVAMVARALTMNGISTVIVNYCTHIDTSKFKITVFVGSPIDKNMKASCEAAGAKVVELPNRDTDMKGFYRALNKGLGKQKFDIIHVHGNSAIMAIELMLAKLHGIKVRIAHSHNTTSSHMKAHKLMKPFFNALYTDGFACCRYAGKWLFGDKKFTVIPNGFNIDKFRFNKFDRHRIRKSLGITDEIVLGHIGRLNHQKNQEFMLKVYEAIAAKGKRVKALLVGDGPDLEELQRIIDNSSYKDGIIMYGTSTNPAEMYSAMDSFVFPSVYEGLPVTLLEAQLNGLPCVISDTITNEVIINPNVKKISLSKSPSEWADEVLKKLQRCSPDEKSFVQYRIDKSVKKLEHAYLEAIAR